MQKISIHNLPLAWCSNYKACKMEKVILGV